MRRSFRRERKSCVVPRHRRSASPHAGGFRAVFVGDPKRRIRPRRRHRNTACGRGLRSARHPPFVPRHRRVRRLFEGAEQNPAHTETRLRRKPVSGAELLPNVWRNALRRNQNMRPARFRLRFARNRGDNLRRGVFGAWRIQTFALGRIFDRLRKKTDSRNFRRNRRARPRRNRRSRNLPPKPRRAFREGEKAENKARMGQGRGGRQIQEVAAEARRARPRVFEVRHCGQNRRRHFADVATVRC